MGTVKLMRGAMMDPTRAEVDPAPRPAFRMTVGNCSVEKMYIVP